MNKLFYLILIFFIENTFSKEKKKILNIPVVTIPSAPLSKNIDETKKEKIPEVTMEEFLSLFPEAMLSVLDIQKDEINFKKFQTAIKSIYEITFTKMEIVDRMIRYSFLDKEGAKKKMEELESRTERAKTVWQNFKERLSWKYLSLIYSRDFINNIYPYIELLVTSIIATRLRNEARKKRQLPLETFNPQELISAFFDQVQINYTNKTAAELKEIIQKSILKTFKK